MKRWKFLGLAAAVAVLSLSGVDKPPQVEEVYVVQPGDTLYSICINYREKDTTDPYILEYIDTIREHNPQLVESKNQLQVGDKLKMVYRSEM